MDEDTLLAVRVEEDKDGYLKIKSPDKAVAREQLMKHLGMFERDNVQKPLVGVNVVHQPGFRSVEFDPLPVLATHGHKNQYGHKYRRSRRISAVDFRWVRFGLKRGSWI